MSSLSTPTSPLSPSPLSLADTVPQAAAAVSESTAQPAEGSAPPPPLAAPVPSEPPLPAAAVPTMTENAAAPDTTVVSQEATALATAAVTAAAEVPSPLPTEGPAQSPPEGTVAAPPAEVPAAETVAPATDTPQPEGTTDTVPAAEATSTGVVVAVPALPTELCIGGALFKMPLGEFSTGRVRTGRPSPRPQTAPYAKRCDTTRSHGLPPERAAAELLKIDLLTGRSLRPRTGVAGNGGAYPTGRLGRLSPRREEKAKGQPAAVRVQHIEPTFGTGTLHSAACAGDAAALAKLIDACRDIPNAVDAPGYVALNGNSFGLKRSGGTYTIGFGARASPLQFAAALGHAGAVQTLLAAGAVDARDSSHSGLPSPSALAAANGFTSLQLLFDHHRRRRPATGAAKANPAAAGASRTNSAPEEQKEQPVKAPS